LDNVKASILLATGVKGDTPSTLITYIENLACKKPPIKYRPHLNNQLKPFNRLPNKPKKELKGW